MSAWAAVVLGAVFVVSGAAKVVAPNWPEQAAALGVPTFVARVLPWFELLVGAAAVAGFDRRLMALLLAAALVSFTAVLVGALRRGVHPPCACFGSLRARPLGWGSVVRNVGLLVLAVMALA